MSYRIDELEKKITKMEEDKKEEEDMEEEIEVKEEIEMSSVLNGAPKATKPITNTRRTASPQAAFLKKLYN